MGSSYPRWLALQIKRNAPTTSGSALAGIAPVPQAGVSSEFTSKLLAIEGSWTDIGSYPGGGGKGAGAGVGAGAGAGAGAGDGSGAGGNVEVPDCGAAPPPHAASANDEHAIRMNVFTVCDLVFIVFRTDK